MRTIILSVLALTSASIADIRLPAVFSDHMVIQRSTNAPVWGWARPGESVRVEADWPGATPASAATDEHGLWRVELATPDAGGPYTIVVTGGQGYSATVRDVWCGEVWLCSGQSNMEWSVAQSDGAAEHIAGASRPGIRLFMIPNTVAAQPRIDAEAAWTICAPETVRDFSAVGYAFGRRLHEELGVPVGLISADWGGTVAQAWMSPGALAPFKSFDAELDYVRRVADPVEREAMLRASGEGWWNALDPKPLAGWGDPKADDSAWTSCSLPATWGADGGLGAFDGIAYFRRTIDLPAAWEGKDAILELGPIDDYDDVRVNGRAVGATHGENEWATPRRYNIPSGVLHAGTNLVAVRVLDTAGPGGINGTPDQMRLSLVSGAGTPIPLAGAWKFAKGPEARALPARDRTGIGPNTASCLFNGMIAPIQPLALRGAIWYQGESNRGAAEQYRELFPALIRDWRAGFARDLSFYFVQLAPFNYGGDSGQTAMIREAQLRTLALPKTGMAVTMDIGNPADIHPTNKDEVGRRLSLWALAKDYGRDREVSGPLYAGAMRSHEGSEMRIRFDHADGLMARGGAPSHLIIAGADRRWHKAVGQIRGNELRVSSPNVPAPAAVRYAWEDDAEPNLFNADGLPASPFRTDDWPGPFVPPSNDDDVSSYRGAEPGFVELFNGRDLAGWHNVNTAPATWTIGKDDLGGPIIRCTGVPTGVLRTTSMYENFVLELEWRHLQSPGNAGLFVWSDGITARGVPFTRSVEVQVMVGSEGDWFTSDGDIFPIHGAVMTPENGRGGSRAFPTEKRMNPSPLWNHYRVTCIDGTISLAVNGKVVTRGKDISPRKGFICLESEGTPIDFRNIRIKPLPSKGALEPKLVASADEGFVPLYTGVDFAGWKFGPEHQGHWKADDWTITFDGQGADLWTEKSYKDFVLVADWRWTSKGQEADLPVILPNSEQDKNQDGTPKTARVVEAGDSGIYLRGSSKSQVNIWCWPIGSGEVYGYRTDGSMTPAVRAAVTPRKPADAPIGEWNRFVITMKGDRLTVVLNGQTVIENASLPGVAPAGPIALQMHGSPIQFANLLIKELK